MVIVGLILTLAFVVLYGLGGYFAFRYQNNLGHRPGAGWGAAACFPPAPTLPRS